MANQNYGKAIMLDTAGIIFSRDVCVTAVSFIPSAVSQTALFTYADARAYVTDEIFTETYTGTITSGTTLTVSGGTLLPSSYAVGDFFRIVRTSGTEANVPKGRDFRDNMAMITTAGTNTVVVCAGAGWTNEATKKYEWIKYTGLEAFRFLASTVASSNESKHISIPGGVLLPCLALAQITSGAKCILYYK